MELKFQFDSESKGDNLYIRAIGMALVAGSREFGVKEEPTPSVETPGKPEEPTPETAVTAEPEQPKKDEPAPEKPKRKRRTKAEVEAEKNDAPEPQEAPTAPEEASQQPVTVEPELPFDFDQPRERPATMTVEEWKDVFKQKRIELELCDANGNAEGAKNANARMDFIDFIYKLSEPYGAPKPKDLSDEKRADFYYEKFQYVQYDPALGFYVGDPAPQKAPF